MLGGLLGSEALRLTGDSDALSRITSRETMVFPHVMLGSVPNRLM